ncbi:hypothetical protein ACROYT_G003927 [Oculina patagonica]
MTSESDPQVNCVFQDGGESSHTFHHETQNEGVNPRAKNPDNAQINDEDVRNSYASAAKAAAPEGEFPISYVPDEENKVPERPCTAFVNPIPARDFFEALNNAEIDSNHLLCIQHLLSGKVLLTFRNAEFCGQFLRRNVLEIRGQPFALQDVDKPQTYLQIFDAPYEMPDSTIINRLAKFCDVLHHRRGYFREPGFRNIQAGWSRHTEKYSNDQPEDPKDQPEGSSEQPGDPYEAPPDDLEGQNDSTVQNLDEPTAANNTFVSPPPADQNRNSGTRETSLSDVEDFKSADRIESDKLSEEDEEESVEQNSPPPQRP